MRIRDCKTLIEDAVAPGPSRGQEEFLTLIPFRAFVPRVRDSSNLLTLDETRARMKQAIADFDKSDTWRYIETTLESLDALPRLDKMLAFGCGEPSDRRYGVRYAMQHAFMLRLGAWIAERQGHDVACYTQERYWYDQDRQALTEAGYIVMDNPKGFLEVADNTAVFAFNCVWLQPVTLELGKPGLLFCNTFTDTPVDMAFEQWISNWTDDEDDNWIPPL